MSVDIESLSAKELTALINEAKKRKTTLSKRKPITQARKRVMQAAKNEGYTIAELFGGSGAARAETRTRTSAPRKARKTTGKVAPKYRNPENANETWTGRGRQPRWLTAFTDAGRNRDEFLINPEG
ncbi:H-NS histone family protein [Lysobacter sp. H23M47]|uniref:H-NS histone family protein n=1 Tax=Lysobacter sp. H23M47 TaxID=2781024 RepID=UPI0018816F57|nr:H-NS histone family protein [Lysobacter sp. H23M47]QOW24147.1 H-NS histone family protein [Lysobacter sp. H23M47]